MGDNLWQQQTTVSGSVIAGTLEDLEYALSHPGSHSKCVALPKSQDGRLQVLSPPQGVCFCCAWASSVAGVAQEGPAPRDLLQSVALARPAVAPGTEAHPWVPLSARPQQQDSLCVHQSVPLPTAGPVAGEFPQFLGFFRFFMLYSFI